MADYLGLVEEQLLRNAELLSGELSQKRSTLGTFFREIEDVLNGKAAEKGYDSAGADGPPSPLDAFLSQEFPDHALGEIVCKCVRFKAKNDPTDLVKIAAWAYLLYRRWIRT